MEQRRYAMAVETDLDPATAETRIRESLAEEGFGILTEIDVAATLAAKLGVDRPPYKILGACNPALANQALQADEEVGVLLPCNVAIYAAGGRTTVAAIEPLSMVELSGEPGLMDVAAEARKRLERALGVLETK